MTDGPKTSAGDSESFHPDRAINSATEDTLGRAKLAQNLGARLAAWRGDSSLVVALFGDWGTGKTSVKNMALEHIRGHFADKAQIVEFNPWQIHGLEQLTESFFREIGPKLATEQRAEDAVNRKQSWERYADHVGAGLSVAKALRFALPMLGVPLTEPILGKVQEALENIKDLTEKGGGVTGAAAEPESLAELKEKLRTDLLALPHSVLVVIDDLDRLTADEVCHVLRLVKANADLPNFCFLLLCERTNVEKALGSISNGRGEAFLEKIVQVPIEVPAPPIQKIHERFSKSVDRILSEVGITKEDFDSERWANIWIPGISKYFANLRHVDRFLNAYSVAAGAFRSEHAYEVNPVDLIAVECLRVFEPAALAAIRANKAALTSAIESSDDKELSAALDEILAAAKNKAAVREMVEGLFPTSHRVWRNMGYSSGTYQMWKNERRLCDADFFERYFLLDVPEGQVSESDIARVLQKRHDREELRTVFIDLIARDLIVPALMRLEANDDLNDPSDAEPYLLALCDVADMLPDSSSLSLFGERSARAFVRYALNRVLGKMCADDQKVNLIANLIMKADSLSMPADWVSRLVRKTDDDSLFPAASDEVNEKLKAHLTSRMTMAAQADQLLNHPDLEALLYRWSECDGEGASTWVDANLATPESGVVILEKLARKTTSQSMGSYLSRQHRTVYRDALERFAPFERWIEMVDQIADPSSLPEPHREVVRAFRAAQSRRERNIADDSWHTDEES